MDPNVTVRCINEALDDNDCDAAAYLARELRGWLDRGGFAPAAALSEKAQKRFPSLAGMLSAHREAASAPVTSKSKLARHRFQKIEHHADAARRLYRCGCGALQRFEFGTHQGGPSVKELRSMDGGETWLPAAKVMHTL